MISVDPTFFLVLLGWSIFSPFAMLFAGWYARGGGEDERQTIR